MKTLSWFWILLATGLLLAYGYFNPDTYAFPKCPVRSLTGWLCPGCGSQRALHQALHGHLASAFSYNPLFLPAVAYALLGVLASKGFPSSWPRWRVTWFGKWAAYTWLVVIIVFTIGRNLISWP